MRSRLMQRLCLQPSSLRSAARVRTPASLKEQAARVLRTAARARAWEPNRQPSAWQYEALLQWADLRDSQPLVAVREGPPGTGRGLFALEDIPPGHVILSVPLSRVFSSQPDNEQQDMHWAADMAAALLREAAHCARGAGGSQWCAWMECLPAQCVSPLLMSEDDLCVCGDQELAHEVVAMRECMDACWQELQAELSALGFSSVHFLWAVQLLNSRCFYEPTSQRHLAVPGIDMANHSFQPSAHIRVAHSAHACQGAAALEDVCDPASTPAAPSTVDLLAGERGISAGDEVSISYGPWPAEVFFTLFGFVPQPNPHDSVALFADATDVAAFLLRRSAEGSQAAAAVPLAAQERQLATRVQAAFAGEDCARLSVTYEGLDSRLPAVLTRVQQELQALHEQDSGRTAAQVNALLGEVVLARCQEVIAARQAALAAATGDLVAHVDAAPLRRLATDFAHSKVRLLAHVLGAMAS